jgi:Ca-activated chloride channel family protein
MKTWLTLLLGLLASRAFGYGVVVLDAETLHLLPPQISRYQVQVENQVAVTRVHTEFINPTNGDLQPTWVFPLGSEAAATRLRYRLDGDWHEVGMGIGGQDPGLPGDEVHPALAAYMGSNPLVFHFENPLHEDSTLVIELDYVELLPYQDGVVGLRHPGDLSAILPWQIISAGYELTLLSDMTVLSLDLISGHEGGSVFQDEAGWHIQWEDPATYPDEHFRASYQLSQDELGLFATSTTLPDSLMPEDGLAGFAMLRAQPDPDDASLVMDKVFTLVIDRSGSMAGDKIIQARNAAHYIVDHLNQGDRFNLVAFATGVSSFRTGHVDFTPANAAAAHSWINALVASGSTNISGAFDLAVPQFGGADSTTANILIFFTDGIPTAGIAGQAALVAHVDALFDEHAVPLNLFCFGIGGDVNTSLLGQLAVHNNGFAEFLEDDELEARISEFYRLVRNPVLINPTVEADPPVLAGLAPLPLANLYVGRQLVVAARYSQAVPVTLTLTGSAFGNVVSYQYPLELEGGYDPARAYLPKVWAKSAIETLLVEYSQLDPESVEALELREEIVQLSLTWGVVSPFTHFDDETGLPREDGTARPGSLLLVGNHPNPFNPSTTLEIQVPAGLPGGALVLRIYNLRGERVRTLGLLVTGPGLYRLVWDGCDEQGVEVASGTYLAVASLGNHLAAHRMLLVR